MNKASNFLDGSFLTQLEKKLEMLPSYQERNVREESWMTAAQIAQWYAAQGGTGYTPKEIDAFLVDRWKQNTLGKIRPAKYPHSKTWETLWGNTDRVYRYPANIPLFNT